MISGILFFSNHTMVYVYIPRTFFVASLILSNSGSFARPFHENPPMESSLPPATPTPVPSQIPIASLGEPNPETFESGLIADSTKGSSLLAPQCDFRKGECAPLVVDFNKDGQVSGILRSGISLNTSDFKMRTGAATNGDKMLAMCDLNKNGVIDGTEVFSDITEFPLFPTQNRSANGFTALHRVAQAIAFRYPDLSIVRWYQHRRFVMLDLLQTALRRMKCDLGFISDDNRDPGKLEPLGHVLGIDVTGFATNTSAVMGNDGIVRYHTSAYLDSDGNVYPVAGLFFSS